MPKFLDLFAGAGGLSEGFIQAGYTPIAHVEMDVAACYTLKTRVAYHWLKANGNLEVYHQYLRGEIKRDEFYAHIPEKVLNSVLNYEISNDTIPEIFEKVDHLLGGEELDLIIGGPPCQAYSLDRHYAEFLRKYRPKYFVFENVLGLLSAKDEDGSRHFDNMLKLFKEYGYSTEFRPLNASDYSVFAWCQIALFTLRRCHCRSGHQI